MVRVALAPKGPLMKHRYMVVAELDPRTIAASACDACGYGDFRELIVGNTGFCMVLSRRFTPSDWEEALRPGFDSKSKRE
jgi:hypothetical protein